MKIADYAITLVLVAILLFLSLPKGGGVWLSFALPVFIVWGLYAFVRIALSSAGRRTRVIRMAIWVTAFGLAAGTQAYWEATSRRDANSAVTALLAYKNRNGAYPARLADTGINEQTLSDEWSINYRLREGKPDLSYPASFMPLSMYQYDFGTNEWLTIAY